MILLKKVNLIKFVKKSVEEVSTDFDILLDVAIIELISEVFYSNSAVDKLWRVFQKLFDHSLTKKKFSFHAFNVDFN